VRHLISDLDCLPGQLAHLVDLARPIAALSLTLYYVGYSWDALNTLSVRSADLQPAKHDADYETSGLSPYLRFQVFIQPTNFHETLCDFYAAGGRPVCLYNSFK
jgi:hypothetical protein